jgi:hypothetical protein
MLMLTEAFIYELLIMVSKYGGEPTVSICLLTVIVDIILVNADANCWFPINYTADSTQLHSEI